MSRLEQHAHIQNVVIIVYEKCYKQKFYAVYLLGCYFISKYFSVSVYGKQSPLSHVSDFDRRKLCATFIYEIYENEYRQGVLTATVGTFRLNAGEKPFHYLVHCLKCSITKRENLFILQLPRRVNQVLTLEISENRFRLYEIHNLTPEYMQSGSSG